MFRFRVILHKICFFVPQYQIFVSTVTVFEQEGVSAFITNLFHIYLILRIAGTYISIAGTNSLILMKRIHLFRTEF